MAFTQKQLDVLEEAITNGVLEVQYTDKKVKYRSLAEMMQLRDKIREELGIVKKQAQRLYMSHCKGLK